MYGRRSGTRSGGVAQQTAESNGQKEVCEEAPAVKAPTVKVEPTAASPAADKPATEDTTTTQSVDVKMETDVAHGQKRKFPVRTGGQFKRPRVNPCHPLLLMNQLKRSVRYAISKAEGEAEYTCTVEIDEEKICASAVDKQDAKTACARAAIQHFIKKKDNDIYSKLVSRFKRPVAEGEEEPPPPHDDRLMALMKNDEKIAEDSKIKTPSMVLKEKLGESGSKCTYEMIHSEGLPYKKRMVVRCTVDKRSFEGVATNYRIALKHAARAALAGIFQIYIPDPVLENITRAPGNCLKETVIVLQEMVGSSVRYEVAEPNPEMKRRVVVKTTINGHTFEGIGFSKKFARAKCAQAALAALYGVNNEDPIPVESISLFKSPVNILSHIMGPNVIYEEADGDARFQTLHSIKVLIRENYYCGTGSSKKAAQEQAARDALAKVFYMTTPQSVCGTLVVQGGDDAVLAHNTIIPELSKYMKPATQILMQVHKQPLSYSEAELPEGGVKHQHAMKVCVAGKEFIGVAASKKEAKYNAAKKALQDVYGMSVDSDLGMAGGSAHVADIQHLPPASHSNIDLSHSNPTQTLYQKYGQGKTISYQLFKEEGDPPNRMFTMQVTVDGQTYVGKAPEKNKKLAKHAASQAALDVIAVPQDSNSAAGFADFDKDMAGATNGVDAHLPHHVALLKKLDTFTKHEYTLTSQENTGPKQVKYQVQVLVRGKPFLGEAFSRRDADNNAARCALAAIFNR